MSQLAAHRAGIRRFVLGDAAVVGLGTGQGSRGTALLLPGYTGSKEDFAPLLTPLSDAGYRVLAVDQPGQYESPGPDAPERYTVDWLAQVLLAVVTQLDDGPVHLLGHSFGGLVARAMVIAEPASFRSLSLLCSGPAAIAGARRDRMEALEPLLPQGMAVLYDAIETYARSDPKWKAAPPDVRAFLKKRFVASSAAGLRGMGDALGSEPDRTADLAAAGVPILVCYGENDDAWRPDVQAEMAARLGARREVIPAAAHSPAIENTAPTVGALLSFWDEVVV